MNKILLNKLEEVFSIPGVIDEFENCEDAEAAQKLFKEKGYDFSDAEMIEMAQMAVMSNTDVELEENVLDDVSGGGLGKTIRKTVWRMTKDYYRTLKSAFGGSIKNAFNQGREFGKKW